MRKSDIEKLARQRPAKRTAPDARERPATRTDGDAVNLSRETIGELADAVAAAIVAHLNALLPVCARLAAADTIHTAQKPETVLRSAISEGALAAQIIEGGKP